MGEALPRANTAAGPFFDEDGPGPLLSQWRLRRALRQLREEREITQDELARAMSWSVSKVMRIEAGASRISVTDLRAVLRLYEIDDDATISALVEWARRARHRGWWTEYHQEIPKSFEIYVGLESDASIIRSYVMGIVHGLLQTQAYARQVIGWAFDADKAERRVALRQARQRRVLYRDNPAQLVMVLDEMVLHRGLGRSPVMHEQLRHLATVAQLPHINLHILPITVDFYPGLGEPFSILEFDDGDRLIYTEGYTGDIYQNNPKKLDAACQLFETLVSLSTAPEETWTLLNELIIQANRER